MKKETATATATDEFGGDDISVDHEESTSTTNKDVSNSSTYAIAEKETRQVMMQKLLVLVVLLLAALAICLVVYFITTNAEEDEFEAHFEGGAEKIVSSFEAIIQEKLGAVGSLCLAFTAQGKNLNVANVGAGPDGGASAVDADAITTSTNGHLWPFVTMDSFQERAASARILSNVLHMSLLPIVTEDNREAWEAYSVQNADWYSEGFAYQQVLLENGFSLADSEYGVRALNSVPSFQERDPRTRGRMLQTNNETEEEFTLFLPKIYEFTEYWEIVFPPAENAPFLPVW